MNQDELVLLKKSALVSSNESDVRSKLEEIFGNVPCEKQILPPTIVNAPILPPVISRPVSARSAQRVEERDKLDTVEKMLDTLTRAVTRLEARLNNDSNHSTNTPIGPETRQEPDIMSLNQSKTSTHPRAKSSSSSKNAWIKERLLQSHREKL